ncbi:MAG: hypothetical protein JXK05_07590 [Campylobacterales bacterium]|nr:hypothetical protein [Campylobacterales bacterium]
MLKPISHILSHDTHEEILQALQSALVRGNESPFWRPKILPLCAAVLSVLLPLRDQNLLFTPEGKPAAKLDAALFLRWCDLYSLRMLYFLLQRSNLKGALEATKLDPAATAHYETIDLKPLQEYLHGYSVDLHREMVDFPISNYNLHLGLADILKKLLQE